jgi:hypothetical protein
MKKKTFTKEILHRFGLLTVVLGVLVLFCLSTPHMAQSVENAFDVKGLSIMGFFNQSIAYNLHQDQANNKDNFGQFITQALLETRYEATPDLVMFNSLKFNADWAYPIYSGTNEWKGKEFDRSRDRLFILYRPRDAIGEAHITWKPNQNWYFRFGKQIVQWGETDAFLLMNQINPVDSRRGITDVSFENTLIPTWMIRAEYRVPDSCLPNWLQELYFQGLFIPNADFAKNEEIEPGNDFAGVWGPHVEVPLGGPYPHDYAYLGKFRDQVSEPDTWDPQGHAFGLRVSGNVLDARVTLNGYYGRNHELARSGALGADLTPFKWDGRFTLHPHFEAYYPIFKFVGATITKDLDWLKASALGNVAPVFRFEGLYAFDNTFSTNNNNFAYYLAKQGDNFWKSDELRLMMGADWKIRINPLNDKGFFFISGQAYWRHINEYPGADAAGVQQHLGTRTTDKLYKDTWTTSIVVNTTYMRGRLQPGIFWLRNWSTRAEFFAPSISFELNEKWKYKLGAFIYSGTKSTVDLQPFSFKDHIFFTTSYRFQ